MNAENFLYENRYGGKEYEEDLIGKLGKTDTPEFMAEVQRLRLEAEKKGRILGQNRNSLPFWEAVKITKKFQSEDPTNPSREFSRELRLAFADALGLEEQDLDKVGIYTAVGGPLDHHGVDGFLDVDIPGSRQIITFDITKNLQKDVSRADFIVGDDILDRSEAAFNEDDFFKSIDNYAKLASSIYLERISQKRMRA